MTEDVEMATLTLEQDELYLLDYDNFSSMLLNCIESDKIPGHVTPKLKLINYKGKSILFVNDVDRAPRALPRAVHHQESRAHPELPLNSRYRTVHWEFGKDVFVHGIVPSQREPTTARAGGTQRMETFHICRGCTLSEPASKKSMGDDGKGRSKAKGKCKAVGRKAYDVTRGVDFVDVASMVNFDIARYRAYASGAQRAGTGMVLSCLCLGIGTSMGVGIDGGRGGGLRVRLQALPSSSSSQLAVVIVPMDHLIHTRSSYNLANPSKLPSTSLAYCSALPDIAKEKEGVELLLLLRSTPPAYPRGLLIQPKTHSKWSLANRSSAPKDVSPLALIMTSPSASLGPRQGELERAGKG
ncbi:hypothetical protein B0H11DRAFT_1936636 [Mycena galericulata]|nr:hypothetical protein B0H11DRAFT_1936636 [Mycena galericulata]